MNAPWRGIAEYDNARVTVNCLMSHSPEYSTSRILRVRYEFAMVDAQNSTEFNGMIAIRIHAPAFRFHYDLSVRIPEMTYFVGWKQYNQAQIRELSLCELTPDQALAPRVYTRRT